ncbi:MAG: hypothetical protein Q8T08_12000 [Ignavibacteria bacterium]|nr:hypothetical protein [Ignavibacteria bacterium]
MKQFFLLVLLSVLLLESCTNSYKKQLDIPVKGLVPESINIKRYGKTLFELDTSHLQQELTVIQPSYMHFLAGDLNDTTNINQIYNFVTDTQLITYYHRSMEVYPDLSILEGNLTTAFRRFHYHFPQHILPEIYSYISGIRFETPVLTDEHVVVIGIDCYLGSTENIYKQMGIPMYFTNRMTSEHIVNDVFKSIYYTQISPNNKSITILDEMIKAGKLYYYLEAMQPNLTDHILIGYTETQIDWLKKHEGEVWAFLISEEVLYASEFQMFKKLFADGPFTADFSPDAPARIGEWVGWQIIRHYMTENPQMSLPELIQLENAQDILSGSKYRPKK